MQWGSCNFDDLKKFRDNLAKLEAEQQQFCEDCAKELAARLLALVIPRTPVGKRPYIEGSKRAEKARAALKEGEVLHTVSKDRSKEYWSGYMGGTLRRGWTAKTEAEAEAGKGRNGNNVKEFANSLLVTKSGGNYMVMVTNPIQYASYVEFGHRQKPGRYVPQLGKQLKKAWVPGQYMLTISEKQLESLTPVILENKLKQQLLKAFDGL